MHKLHKRFENRPEGRRLTRQLLQALETFVRSRPRNQRFEATEITRDLRYFTVSESPDGRLIHANLLADLAIIQPDLFEEKSDAVLIGTGGHTTIYATSCIKRKECDSCSLSGPVRVTALIASFFLIPANPSWAASRGDDLKSP